MTEFEKINQIAIDNNLPFAYEPEVIKQKNEDELIAVIANVNPIRYEFEF